MFKLDGRVALVTGGSRGIGRACCEALAEQGATVVINYQKGEDKAREVADAIGKAGGKAEIAGFDVADSKAAEAAIEEIAKRHGRLDVLVANAGIAIDGLLLRLKEDDWDRVLDVNLTGAMHVCRAAARHVLKAKEGGRIINLTSVVGETGSAGQVSYVAAKAGLIGLTKTLARELASRGVTVNAVSPGFIETDMTAAHIAGEAREALLKQIPLGRIGRPEEVAEVVRFLASRDAAYVTGQVIRVNGGLLL